MELSWTVGFGAGPSTSVAAADLMDKSGTIRAAADVTMVSPANNLLSDVMKRPAFLPERVLARAAPATDPNVNCPITIVENTADWTWSTTSIESYWTGGNYAEVYFVSSAFSIDEWIGQANDGFTVTFNGEAINFGGIRQGAPFNPTVNGAFSDVMIATTNGPVQSSPAKFIVSRPDEFYCEFDLQETRETFVP